MHFPPILGAPHSSRFTYRDDAYKSHSADPVMKGRHRHGHLVNTMKQMCRHRQWSPRIRLYWPAAATNNQWISQRSVTKPILRPLDVLSLAVADQSTDDLSRGNGHLTFTRREGN